MSQPRVPYRPRPAAAQRIESRHEIEAALAARMELGPEYDEHIAAGLADRIEEIAAYRTAELRESQRSSDEVARAEKSARTQRFVLGLVSLVAGIPVTAISATQVEPALLGVIVSWTGIVGVNVVHGLFNRPRRR